MNFPRHISCSIEHNEHAALYMTVAEYEANHPDLFDWVSDEDRVAALAANELWAFQWYPETPVGFCMVAAATAESLFLEIERLAGADLEG